jgi:predicted exporter
MNELFPILCGIAVGLVFSLSSFRLPIVTLAVLSVACGVLASWISGELAFGAFYVLIDIAQVLGAALVTAFVVGQRRQRTWHLS